jgi:hypothetical protein
MMPPQVRPQASEHFDERHALRAAILGDEPDGNVTEQADRHCQSSPVAHCARQSSYSLHGGLASQAMDSPQQLEPAHEAQLVVAYVRPQALFVAGALSSPMPITCRQEKVIASETAHVNAIQPRRRKQGRHYHLALATRHGEVRGRAKRGLALPAAVALVSVPGRYRSSRRRWSYPTACCVSWPQAPGSSSSSSIA